MEAKRFLLALLPLPLLAGSAAAAEARGVITAVDPARKQLVVDVRGLLAAQGELLALELPADTPVQLGLLAGQAGSVQSLAVGQRVRVSYDERDGKRRVTLVRVVTLLSPAPAAEPASNPVAAPPPANAQTAVVAGTLRYLAITERDILLAQPGPGGKETYTPVRVPESTRIIRDGQPIRLEDLKPEEPVTVQFQMRGGQRLAVSITAGQQSAELPAPRPVPAAAPAAGSRRGDRLRLFFQLASQVVAEAGQGRGPIRLEPEQARKLQKALTAADMTLEQLQRENGGQLDLATIRKAVNMGLALTTLAAMGQAPSDLPLDPHLAAGLNKILVIADQALAFIEQERGILILR